MSPRELPKVWINGKLYYRDDRLRQFREVSNPHNWIDFEDLRRGGGAMNNVCVTDGLPRQLAIQILEVFEDFLEEKNIEIPNEEKKENPNAARLYGEDYYNLEDRVTEILKEVLLYG